MSSATCGSYRHTGASPAPHGLNAEGGAFMRHHGLSAALASAVLAASIGGAAAWDDAKYPDLQGHWARFTVRGLPGQPSFDQTKPWGAGQQAPLTPEYRAIFEASLADQAKGGEGNYTGHARCLAAGMPHKIVAFP